jgi:hypothetical protein
MHAAHTAPRRRPASRTARSRSRARCPRRWCFDTRRNHGADGPRPARRAPSAQIAAPGALHESRPVCRRALQMRAQRATSAPLALDTRPRRRWAARRPRTVAAPGVRNTTRASWRSTSPSAAPRREEHSVRIPDGKHSVRIPDSEHGVRIPDNMEHDSAATSCAWTIGEAVLSGAPAGTASRIADAILARSGRPFFVTDMASSAIALSPDTRRRDHGADGPAARARRSLSTQVAAPGALHGLTPRVPTLDSRSLRHQGWTEGGGSGN